MRNTKWLVERTKFILRRYFPDIRLDNNLVVKFGQKAKTRLGSIKYGSPRGEAGKDGKVHPNTIITLSGYFQDEKVPDFVLDATLAHEISHYSHGFFSPRQRLYHHPHHGGVVKREMLDRGLEDMLKLQKKWLRENWIRFIKKESNE